jgi:hypothetical protein
MARKAGRHTPIFANRWLQSMKRNAIQSITPKWKDFAGLSMEQKKTSSEKSPLNHPSIHNLKTLKKMSYTQSDSEPIIHFVWVYIKFGQVHDEIQSSIRSVEKFFKGERKIFIVGDRPEPFKPYWTHIPHTQVQNIMYAKALDSISKLETIAKEDQINPDFVYMNDDQVFLRQFTLPEISRSIANNHVHTLLDYWNKPGNLPSKTWREQFRITLDYLKRNGKGTWNYETHLPRYFNKALITEVLTTYNITQHSMLTQPILFATLYGNHVRLNPDVSLENDQTIKLGVYRARDLALLKKDAIGKLVMNYNDNGKDHRLDKFIRERLSQ